MSKYYCYYGYDQITPIKLKSNLINIANESQDFKKHLINKLRDPIKFIIYNFCNPLSYDLDKQILGMTNSLLLYKGSYSYYSKLPVVGSITYLSLETINQAMGGKFPAGVDLKTNLFKERKTNE